MYHPDCHNGKKERCSFHGWKEMFNDNMCFGGDGVEDGPLGFKV
jgi:hypothetical protein